MLKVDKSLICGFALAVSCASSSVFAEPAQPASTSVEGEFQNPPNSARPRVWWHWMNGNITVEGIKADLDWMNKVGIGGFQNFDIDLQTPVVVPNRLPYMTPGWKEAFRFTAREADRRGLELGIASSPGWSETGGPWVRPEDGLKKLVWSATPVSGGKRFSGKLAALPDTTGPFLDVPIFDAMAALSGKAAKAPPQHGEDVAVFAVKQNFRPLPLPKAFDAAGKLIDPAAFLDASLVSALDVPRGTAERPAQITLDYGKPVTVRTATFFSLGAKAMFTGSAIEPQLMSSADGKSWSKVSDFAVTQIPTTASFAPVTARYFRLTLKSAAPGGANMDNAAAGVVPPPFAKMLAEGSSAPIKLNAFQLSAEPVIDRFEAKAAFAVEEDYYALRASAGEAGSAGQIVDLTGRMKPDGTLDWTPPSGDWKVIRLGYSLLGTTNHPAPAEATGLEVDKFDGDAVRRYLEHYLQMYRDAAGADMIGKRGVSALLTDSIEVGAANWTPKMLDRFKELRGYDPRPWLPALTGAIVKSRDESERFLYDYRRTLADLMVSEHYGTVAKVAHEHGLKVYGEALEHHRPSLGDDMAMRRFADIPMAALWTFPETGKPLATYVADMKGAASVAHVYGQNLVAAESMTSALRYWADSPRTLKHVIDLEFVTGINRPVIHTSVHSPDEAGEPGLSLMIFGQHFNRHDAWADLAKPWVDYIARNSYMLQRGRNFADVAYFYGEEGPLTALYGDKPVSDAPTRYAYDFVNVGALMDAIRNDGGDLVSTGGARYKILYLGGSSRRMTLPMLRRLAALVEGGATVVGTAPEDSPALGDDRAEWKKLVAKLWPGSAIAEVGKGRVVASSDVEKSLASLGVQPDFSFAGAQADAELPFVHRKVDDQDSYFILNRKNRPEKFEARFRVTGKAPELWRPETGRVEALSYRIEGGETIVPLSLEAEEAVHIVFRHSAPASTHTVADAALKEVGKVDAGWKIAFQPNRGAPASITMASLVPLNEYKDAGVKYYSGIATYSTAFSAPKNWKKGQPLTLDLGDVREVAEVSINGQNVGYAWHAPYRVDVSNAVKPGRNSVQVRVGNLWVNRMIGDAQPGAKPVTKATFPTYSADAPLTKSGLIGPVRLLGR